MSPAHYFRMEARELLASLTQGILALERAEDDAMVSRLLRHAHTLKGAARVVDEGTIADMAHEVEEILVAARARGSSLPSDRVGELFRLLDAMANRVAALEGGAPSAKAKAGAAAEPIPTARVALREMDGLLEGIGEVGVHLAGLLRPIQALEEASSLALALGAQLRARPVRFEDGAAATPRLVPQLDELASALARCRDTLDELRGRSEVELSLVRDRAQGLRLLPAGVLFPGLERAARDAAQALGKHIRFETRGGEVRMDSPVHDLLRDALLHVVRNAVAHGIELPAARAAAGKDPVGTLSLEVERHEVDVVLSCSDDGAGFDLDAIARDAARRGLVAEGAALTLDEALALVRRGGVSTTDAPDQASGRGVGLNVVTAAVAEARGHVDVRSARGRGTTVRIRVPALLQAIPALRVDVAGRPYWIPSEAVLRTDRVAASELRWSESGGYVARPDSDVPVVALRTLLDAGPALGERQGLLLVELKTPAGQAAVSVDRLAGLRTILARPLPPELGGGLVSHTTLDPEGAPELVLNPTALVAAPALRAPRPDGAAFLRRPILVIDDSPTARLLQRSILESAGYETDVVASGEDGLERLRARSYGAVVVDVELPGMDGFQFVATVRADPMVSATPCILLTSRGTPDDRARGRAVGAVGYVVKGEFRQEELLALIRRVAE